MHDKRRSTPPGRTRAARTRAPSSHTRQERRPPARSGEAHETRPSSSPRSRWNVTVVEHRQTSWCGWIVSTLVLVGVAFGLRHFSQGPRRTEVVHTETRDGWTARVMRIGPWSAETRTWRGKSRYEIELVGADNSVHRVRTNVTELELALTEMRAELSKRAAEKPA